MIMYVKAFCAQWSPAHVGGNIIATVAALSAHYIIIT